jgi:hypothetical protein
VYGNNATMPYIDHVMKKEIEDSPTVLMRVIFHIFHIYKRIVSNKRQETEENSNSVVDVSQFSEETKREHKSI